MSEFRKKEILIIIPSLIAGGAERILINILNLIDHDKFNVNLYIGLDSGVLIPNIHPSVNYSIIFPNRSISLFCGKMYSLFGVGLLMKFYGNKITGEYDIGISFLDSFFTQFLFWNKAIIKKKMAVVHSSYSSYNVVRSLIRKGHRKRMIERYKKLDTIVTVSHESMKEFISLFGEYDDMRVIYNPLNTKEIESKSLEPLDLKLDWNRIQIVAIGSLLPVKGYHKLIEACNILRNEGLKFQVTILGDGPLLGELTTRVKSYDLHKEVLLRGYVSNPYNYLRNADLYLMTSDSEGLPTALCEALVLKKATMVTDVTGCREVIDKGKYGMMVANNVAAIARGLALLISDKDLRRKYEQLAEERAAIFSDEVSLNKYLDMIDYAKEAEIE